MSQKTATQPVRATDLDDPFISKAMLLAVVAMLIVSTALLITDGHLFTVAAGSELVGS